MERNASKFQINNDEDTILGSCSSYLFNFLSQRNDKNDRSENLKLVLSKIKFSL
jgi:hypothetical protein